MTANEFTKFLLDFSKHPILVEQEAMIVAALQAGKITKKTAGELMIKVARHNVTKMQELLSMDIEKLIEMSQKLD